MANTKPTSSSFHNTHANTYDRMASNATYHFPRQYLSAIQPPITKDSYVFDNACGTGIVSELIKSTINPSVRILGADLAAAPLAIFEKKMSAFTPGTTSTLVLDNRDLQGLEDNTFTHVITNFGATQPGGESTQQAIREMRRVVKPGGVVVMTSWNERNFNRAMEQAALRLRPDETPFSWDGPKDTEKGWVLFRDLEDVFGPHVEVKLYDGQIEAASLSELVDNMLLFKDMFYKGYSEAELEKLKVVLGEELKKLDAFEEMQDGVRVKMVAWVGMAWK